MIIRSQDKRRITTDLNLHIESIEVGKENIKRVFIKSEKMGTIGVYSTEEKEIEVLNMITKKYTRYQSLKASGRLCEEDSIFQMPSDKEVEV